MSLARRLLAAAGGARQPLSLAVGAGLLAGLATVWQAQLLARVVAGAFLGRQGLADLRAPLALLLLALVVRSALVWLKETNASAAAARALSQLRLRYLAALVELGPAHVVGERTGALANAAVEGVESLGPFFSQFLPSLALAVLVPLAILVCVAAVDPLSALVFALTAPLIPLFTWLVGKTTDSLSKRQWQTLSRLSADFLDAVQGLPTLKVFNRSHERAARLETTGERFRRATMGVLRVAFLSALSQELLATVSTAIVAVEVGLRTLYGGLGFEQAFFVLVLAPEFYQPLRALGASFHASAPGLAAAAEILAMLEGASPSPSQGEGRGEDTGRLKAAPPNHTTIAPHPNPLPAEEGGQASPLFVGAGLCPRPPGPALPSASPTAADRGCGRPRAGTEAGPYGTGPVTRPACINHPEEEASLSPEAKEAPLFPLVFDDVRYAYEAGRRPALRGLSFAIREGETVALVGPSGSGKSTVAALLLRFLEPDGGDICAGRRSLSSLPPLEWRRLLSWLPQSPYLFNATVAENIALARPEASAMEVAAAARLAGCEDFLARLPAGLATPVGERGARLSGGQAQRVALARAFLRDAPLVILDEALANLDPAQAAGLDEVVARLLRDRTALIIAHRLATIRQADRIVVLSAGRVVESGRHEELLAAGGLYSRLATASLGVAP